MTREELQKWMDEAARNYARTHDPKYEAEVWRLNDRLTAMCKIDSSITLLDQALAHCRQEDIRTAEVYAALDFLAARAEQKWPFEQFREALENDGSEGWQAEGRYQMLNASLNGIKLALAAGSK